MFNPASCVFCDKLFTLPLGGVISAYGAVCNGCKTKALTETDSSIEIEADRPDPTQSYGFDDDWQDTMKSDGAFERAWALLKNEEWDDDEPLPYDTDKYHDQEKIDEIQRIFDDIAQRNYEESQAREPTDIEELMQMVGEYEDTGYDGPTESGALWENRWNIPPPGAGWRMFADSASEFNVEHLLNSGWDPEHIRIIRLGPGEHTPWGYMGGQDTVWVSSASPNFKDTMAHYVKDEPEDYDPWRGME